MVVISAWNHVLDIAEHVAFECNRLGANPLIVLSSNWYEKRIMREGAASPIGLPRKHFLGAVGGSDVYITISGSQEPSATFGLKPRFRNVLATKSLSLERMLERGLRMVELPAGLLTPAWAKIYKTNLSKWRNSFLRAVLVDPEILRKKAQYAKRTLDNGSSVSVVSNNGTACTLSIEGRRALVNDGMIDSIDMKTRRLYCSLPAGNVIVAPLEASTNGTIVLDSPPIKLGISKGRVTRMTTPNPEKPIPQFLQRMPPNKRVVGTFSINVNPYADRRFPLVNYSSEGTVTFGFGANKPWGGKNSGGAIFRGSIFVSTVKVDGLPLIRSGVLLSR